MVAAYSIPGLWLLAPSSLGFVHYTPFFLSKAELQKAWVSHRPQPWLDDVCPFELVSDTVGSALLSANVPGNQ